MKLQLCLITLFAFCLNTLTAQKTTTDTLATLYKNYMKLMETSQNLDNSVKEVGTKLDKLNEIDNKVKSLNNTLSSSLEQVNRLTENDVLSKKSRLNAQKEKVVKTSVFVGYANNSFDAIDAALAQSDYLNDVADLNNPSNTDLGFSLNEEITKLLESKIIKGNKKFKDADKLISIAQSIIKDPFVATITSTIPALSAIQGVLNLVSNFIVKEPSVTVEDYKVFKKEMDRYIVHYDGLAVANQNFNSNVQNLSMRLEALRTVMNNYTVERVKTVHPNVNFTPDMALHKVVSTYYTPLDLEKNLDGIILAYKENGKEVNYTAALADSRLAYPFYAINQAQFIRQELETLTNEYVSSYRNYHKSIKNVLEKSKGLSKDVSKIDKKLVELDTKLTRLVSTFEKNVKIESVVKAVNEIPTY
jgi:hypothetical protein